MSVGPVNNQIRPSTPAPKREAVDAPLPGSGQNVPVEQQAVAGSGNVAPQPVQEKRPAPEVPDLQAAVEQIQKYIDSSSRELHFSVQEETGRTIIKVMDPNTGELIRAIPPEEVMAIASMLDANSPKIFNALA